MGSLVRRHKRGSLKIVYTGHFLGQWSAALVFSPETARSCRQLRTPA
jgi:hypothetical protein